MFKPITRLAFLLLTILTISCQKEISVELGRQGTPTVSAVLKMKINGSQWIANRGAGASIIAGFININGLSTDGKALSITLNDSVPGTYVLDQISFNTAALSDSLDNNGLAYTTNEGKDTSQAGGVITVTAIDKANKTISGTFHFKAYREFDSKQKQITEGVFNKLPYVATLPAANLTDTFHVKIDNVDWTAKSIIGSTSGTDIYISGSELNLSKLVALSIPSNITPGTYNLDAITGTYIGIYSPVSTSIMTSLSGKITILEHNTATKKLRGNFNFIAVDVSTAKSSQLTAGYFSLKYQ